MKTNLMLWYRTVSFTAAIFVVLSARCFAAFPPVLVIGGTAYPGAQGTDSNSHAYSAYTTSNSVLVLYCATGGAVNVGPDLNTALTNPTATGTWDGGMNVSVTGITFAVPQVLVYYPSQITPATMQGYDGVQHQPVGSGTVNGDGEFVVAYSGLTDGYIFDFGSGQPIYRYQAAANPVTLDTTNGWPPPNVFIFPSQITSGGETLSVTSYTNGLSNGYWANAYYATTDGSEIYGELHAYISIPTGYGHTFHPSSGQLYGYVNGSSVSANWDATTKCFVASPGLGVSFTAPSSSPVMGSVQSGPPQVEYNGTLLPFAFNDVNGSDFYWNTTNGTWITINSSDAVTASDGTSYTYIHATEMFSGSANLAAVSADGTTFLGNDGSGGVQVINAYSLYGWIDYLSGVAGDPEVVAAQYNFTLPSGRYAEYFVTSQCPSFPQPFTLGTLGNYDYGTSTPIFAPPGSGQIKTIDVSSGWPAGLPSVPLPNATTLDGQIYFTSLTYNPYPGFSLEIPYTTPDGSSSIECLSTYNETGTAFDLYIASGNDAGANFVLGFTATGATSDDGNHTIQIISGPSGSPSYGPPSIYWYGVTPYFDQSGNEFYGVSFSYFTTQNGEDIYTQDQDPSVPGQITINSNHQVGGVAGSGTYNPATSQFSISGVLALDGNGYPLGISPALVIEVYNSLDGYTGQSIQLQDGSTANATYYIQNNNNETLAVYVGLPTNSLILSDPGLPLCRFSPTGGNDVDIDTNASSDWSASSNLYTNALYIDGHYATLDSTTVSNNGSGGGSATYLVQPETGDSFTINWTWNNGLAATVSGSYLGTSWSNGTWDGNVFGSLPTGMVISASPPPPPESPRFGPQQIIWDGVQLTFNNLASSFTAGNPTGNDVYQDSFGLGIQVTVAADGTVTASQLGGTTFSGTYTASTQQFQFSNGAAGSVQAANSQGFVYPGNGGSPLTLTQNTSDVAGNLAVHGDMLTLGNWTDSSGNSVEAFALAFFPAQNGQPNMYDFAATLQSTEWVWSHATTNGSSTQSTAMALTPGHALQLYSPNNSTTPAIVLDPGGNSHIDQQGDLSMGQFTQQPQQ